MNDEDSELFHWEIRNREGSFWRAIKELASPFEKPFELRRMGFIISSDALPLDVESGDGLAIMHHQQVLATTLNRLLFSQLYSFIRHFSHLTDGYPSRFAFFWNNDDEVAKTFWAEMLDDYKIFLEAKKSSAAAMKKFTARSFLIGSTWKRCLPSMTAR